MGILIREVVVSGMLWQILNPNFHIPNVTLSYKSIIASIIITVNLMYMSYAKNIAASCIFHG